MVKFAPLLAIWMVALIWSCQAARYRNATETDRVCQRECDDGPVQECTYDFFVEYYFVMSKACYDCPLNLTDCDRPHCIAADGIERGIVVVNRQLPGPSIQVCEGDRVVVNVKNHLLAESSSVHWHGLHMVGTPYMDGVPLLTQCPISPGSTFRYNFSAANPGTHFYHSHSGFQRDDGFFGALIVRQSRQKDPHAHLYDYDLSEHVVIVTEWLGELGIRKFLAHHHDDGDNKPTSMLINGKGRIPKPREELTANETVPFSVFQVSQDQRYRFRLINTGFLNCPIQLSIDNHTLLVIASDGAAIEPIRVESLIIDSGERYDFVLEAFAASISNYWIRLHGLMDCTPRRVFQAAILRYQEAPIAEPAESLDYDNTIRSGKMINPVNMAPGDDTHVTAAELKALDRTKPADWTVEPDRKFFLAYDFNPVNNYDFHWPDYYPIYGVDPSHRVFTPQINHISLMMPSSPPLSQPRSISPDMLCNETTVSDCYDDFCACPYTLDIPLGSLVELIIIDEGVTYDATHPFHLHGAAFRVVAMQRVGSNVTMEQVRAMDQAGLIQRNLIDAPLKDTVAVPDGGFTVVRFRAHNPGYWLFHCHLSFHNEIGMGVIFKVGDHSDYPPVPNGFPTCGDWLQSDEFESSSAAGHSRSKKLWLYGFLFAVFVATSWAVCI